MTSNYEQKILSLEQCTPQWHDNYVDHDGSLSTLQQLLSQNQSVMILGPRMSGKSHLLRGAAVSLPHAMVLSAQQEVPLTHLGDIHWLLIDDIDQYTYPEQLVSLSQHQPHIRWLFTGGQWPSLPDLASRCQQCHSLTIHMPQRSTDLHQILKAIASRYQYQIKNNFIQQATDFLPWQPQLIIETFLGYMQHCHTHKKSPNVVGLKNFYGPH